MIGCKIKVFILTTKNFLCFLSFLLQDVLFISSKNNL